MCTVDSFGMPNKLIKAEEKGSGYDFASVMKMFETLKEQLNGEPGHEALIHVPRDINEPGDINSAVEFGG